MDEKLITLWNERVKPEDTVIHLGDVTMPWGKWAKREEFVRLGKSLNGKKELILGNHDEFPPEWYVEAGFERLHALIVDKQYRIVFSHYPLHPKQVHTMTANVHGHIHTFPDMDPIVEDYDTGKRVVPYVNISIEKTNYHPISLEEVQDRIRTTRDRWEAEHP